VTHLFQVKWPKRKRASHLNLTGQTRVGGTSDQTDVICQRNWKIHPTWGCKTEISGDLSMKQWEDSPNFNTGWGENDGCIFPCWK